MEDHLKKQIETIEDYMEWIRFLSDKDTELLSQIIVSQMTKDQAFAEQIYDQLLPVRTEAKTMIDEFQSNIRHICKGDHPEISMLLDACRKLFMLAPKLEKLQDRMYLMIHVIKDMDHVLKSTEVFSEDDWLIYESMDIAEENMTMYMDIDFAALPEKDQKDLISWLKKEAEEYSPSDGDNRIANVLEGE